MEKLPPIKKIYEAYSALADGRVKLSDSDSCFADLIMRQLNLLNIEVFFQHIILFTNQELVNHDR